MRALQSHHFSGEEVVEVRVFRRALVVEGTLAEADNGVRHVEEALLPTLDDWKGNPFGRAMRFLTDKIIPTTKQNFVKLKLRKADGL